MFVYDILFIMQLYIIHRERTCACTVTVIVCVSACAVRRGVQGAECALQAAPQHDPPRLPTAPQRPQQVNAIAQQAINVFGRCC